MTGSATNNFPRTGKWLVYLVHQAVNNVFVSHVSSHLGRYLYGAAEAASAREKSRCNR